MYQRETFKITLLCHNCTNMAIYEFPQRRRFYGYHPDFYDQDGEIIDEQVWSKVGSPFNEQKADIVTCINCKVPMLTGAPIQLGQNPPQIGTGVVQ